jgi:hypothetical protein
MGGPPSSSPLPRRTARARAEEAGAPRDVGEVRTPNTPSARGGGGDGRARPAGRRATRGLGGGERGRARSLPLAYAILGPHTNASYLFSMVVSGQTLRSRYKTYQGRRLSPNVSFVI